MVDFCEALQYIRCGSTTCFVVVVQYVLWLVPLPNIYRYWCSFTEIIEKCIMQIHNEWINGWNNNNNQSIKTAKVFSMSHQFISYINSKLLEAISLTQFNTN